MTIIHTYISKQRGRGLGDDWHPSTLTTCQCHTSEFFLPNLTVTRQPTSQCITCNICFLWYTRFLQCLMLYINLLQGCGLYTASRPVLVAPAPLFVRHHRHQRPNCFADLTSHMEEVANIIGSWNQKYKPFYYRNHWSPELYGTTAIVCIIPCLIMNVNLLNQFVKKMPRPE